MLETAKKLLGIPKEPPLQAKTPEDKGNLVKHEMVSREVLPRSLPYIYRTGR